ncbi:MAG: hypothetical protein ABIP35_06025 [Ginsengibacter sp.]
MPRRIHNSFTKSILAVMFMFLNGICIASPALKNTADNYSQNASLNNLETTENQLPAQSLKLNTIRRSVVLVNRANVENLYNNTVAIVFNKSSDFSPANLYLLPKPAYYLLLFHYTLF